MQAQINRITDILRRDDGISGAMQYTEQISRILFLRYFDEYEKNQEAIALLNNTTYTPLLTEEFQRDTRACPKDANGKLDINKAMSGDDLKIFVNKKLFPQLKSFRNIDADYHSMKYKIGEIFYFVSNRIESGHTLREILDIIDGLSFQSKDDLFELSHIYENLLQGMGNDGGNSGEFYTPRPVIKAMVQCLDPKIWQTVYDGAAGSCGFLIEAFEYMKPQANSTDDLKKLHHDTFYGIEKTPIAYTMGVMNMILHGIENPNLDKRNTLTNDIRKIEEKDRFDVIIANPPFWGKEKSQIQTNFPIKTTATEMLFLQHFMKSLKTWGKAAIIVPEGVLFNTSNAFKDVKKQLLEDFNVIAIVSLPSGVFLPYAGVKTNVLFFEKTTSTKKIRYYEVDPGRKLTKNKPITVDELQEMIDFFPEKTESEQSRFVHIDDINDFDLSAKNPNKIKEITHLPPKEILAKIKANDEEIRKEVAKLEEILL